MGTLANSVDPDEMQHNAAFHQGLDCLLRLKQQKYITIFFIKFYSVTPLNYTMGSPILIVSISMGKSTKITFCGFPWVETSTAGRVYDLCVYYMTGAPEGSPKVVLCGFMVLWRSRESNLRPLVYKA